MSFLVLRASPSRLVSPRRAIRALSTVTETRSPSPKISSVPFHLKPEDALNRLHVQGLVASASMSNLIFAFLLRFFGPSITPLAREFGMGESLQMRDMKAVLYPIWRVDAILDGEAGKISGGREAKGWIAIREGYVPGNPFAPLSYISYAIPPLVDELDTYDPQRDLTQLGEGFEVVPVPFTASPLGVIGKLRKMIGRRSDWEGLKIDESKWKETMVGGRHEKRADGRLHATPSCFQSMLPSLSTRFRRRRRGDSRSRWMPTTPRASFPPPSWMQKNGHFDKNYYVNPAPFLPMVNFLLPLPPSSSRSHSPSLSAILSQTYQMWMSPAPTASGDLIPSPMVEAEAEGIDWDDVRIQSWSSEERMENGEYMEKGYETHKTIGALEVCSADRGQMFADGDPDQSMATTTKRLPSGANPKAMVLSMGSLTKGKVPSLRAKSMSEVEKEMKESVAERKQELAALKPAWLRVFDETRESDV
ncbi:hypothetical protein P7C73_g748, partial [Tremellales sp. Uapishka_1]